MIFNIFNVSHIELKIIIWQHITHEPHIKDIEYKKDSHSPVAYSTSVSMRDSSRNSTDCSLFLIDVMRSPLKENKEWCMIVMDMIMLCDWL